MRRLRILQIFSRYLEYGGEEYIAGRIEDALAERHEMFRYVGSTQKLFQGGIPARAMMPGRTWFNREVAQDLRKEQRQKRHDAWVVHNVFPALSPAVYAVARELGVPIIHYLHNYRMSCANGYFLNRGLPCERCAQGNFWPAFATACWRESHFISGWMGMILQQMRHDDIFRQIRAWVAPSEFLKSVHIRMGLSAGRIEVIPHFLDAQNDPPATNPKGGVLFLGRLSREKGVEVLLQAWGQLKTKERVLYIAGTGPEEAKLKQQAKDLKLTNVEWLGFVPRQKQGSLWAKTAFSVVPSIWNEPYGMCALESWGQRRPFIASRGGALAEILKDQVGGVLVPPGSPTDLAEQIEHYFQNPESVEKDGLDGQRKLLRLHTRQKWTEKFQEVLEHSLSTDVPGMRRTAAQEADKFYACTLFDSGFLAKGLALLASLKRQGLPFRLHVFAMDDFTADYLDGLQDPDLKVIRKQDFEDGELQRVRAGRTRSEYYWTCGSSTLLYCLEKLGLPRCTYLDADVCFYAPAQELEARMGEASIGITPHAYAAAYDQNRSHGVYCVQYVTIRNDGPGLRALRWWREKCLEWCFARVEAGRFGDQKYLDDWPERFSGVKILDGPGVGLAPWNCRNYELMAESDGKLAVRDLSNGSQAPLIFYHFHELRLFTRHRVKLMAGGYEISPAVRKEIYQPYLRDLIRLAGEITQKHPQANPLAIGRPDFWKMAGAKVYAALNPNFHDHYISLREALGE